jgi:photosystem II stability/assembly factor-like uncharacterized protein
MNFLLLVNFSISTEHNWTDIQFIDSDTGYVCYKKKLYKTTDGGDNWQPVVSMENDKLIEIYFTDATHGWACGDGGLY